MRARLTRFRLPSPPENMLIRSIFAGALSLFALFAPAGAAATDERYEQKEDQEELHCGVSSFFIRARREIVSCPTPTTRS